MELMLVSESVVTSPYLHNHSSYISAPVNVPDQDMDMEAGSINALEYWVSLLPVGWRGKFRTFMAIAIVLAFLFRLTRSG